MIQREWQIGLERLQAIKVVELLCVDSQKLKQDLTDATSKALTAMLRLLAMAARLECRMILEKFAERQTAITAR